jgi:hypothetical protein
MSGARRVIFALAIAAPLVASCSRAKSSGGAAPSASASASASAMVDETTVFGASRDVTPPPSDAMRIRVSSVAGMHELAPHEATVQAAFGAKPVDVQRVPLAGERRAFLLTSTGEGEAKQMVIVVDASRNVVWARERPLAGPRPTVRHVALAAGPNGELFASWFDLPSQTVAARRWTSEGGLLADFRIMDADGVDALSALYWPGRGWVVAASRLGAARAQMLGERGNLAWGAGGRTVSPGWRAAAPMGMALDDGGLVIVQPGYAANGLAKDVPDRFFATRLDGEGQPTWPAAVELGEAPKQGKAPFPKPFVAPSEGGVTATLARGTTDAPVRYEVEITSAGRVVLR